MNYKTKNFQELRNEVVDKFMALVELQKIDRAAKVDGPTIQVAVDDFEAVLSKWKRLK
ncbi:hypothetical protein LCGC14_2271810 [marine sediment metagenome]|uniref:Uncharacterized protein n=1 Tax=marine sediment metagenome TaxID=412755 RepID=A0A0F9CWS7_9ZZZZ